MAACPAFAGAHPRGHETASGRPFAGCGGYRRYRGTLRTDPKTLGFLFESLVTHDVLVYARAMDAQVMHYRDDSGLEVDLIVEMRDGTWGAFEVKLGCRAD